MKVKDLIIALKECNPEAEAVVMDIDANFVPVKGVCIPEGNNTDDVIICDEDTYLGFLE